MRELIGRLEVTDDDAASALRVIAHFDRLVDDRASAPALLRAAAALAGCPAGMHDGATGTTRRVDALGRPLDGAAPDVPWRRLPVDEHRGSSVWLERPGDGEHGPLDDLILERLVKALQVRDRRLPDDRATAVAVRVACDAELTGRERAPALHTLGLRGAVTVFALSGEGSLRGRATVGLRRSADIDGTTAVLVAAGEREPTLQAGRQRAGSAVVDAAELPVGWSRATLALRFAGDRLGLAGPHVRHADLGALADLAERVTPDWAAGVPDVAALEACAVEHPWIPATLHALVGHPSVRQAAASLAVHHSTLQERIAWLEQWLGYSLRDPPGRQRASLALSLWRIASS